MTRSIFDPEGGETEHSGNQNMGPSADNISHLPPDIADGKVSEEEVAEQEAAAQVNQGEEQPLRETGSQGVGASVEDASR